METHVGVTKKIENMVWEMIADRHPQGVEDAIFHEIGLVSVLCRQAGGELRSRQVVASIIARHLVSA